MSEQEFIDQNIFNGPSGINIPDAGQPNAMNTGNAVATPEYLDAIINNPNENPSIRENASITKQRLFPELTTKAVPIVIDDTPSEELHPVLDQATINPVSKKQMTDQLKTKHVTPEDFDSFLNQFTSRIYTDEVKLLSSEENIVQLRSMTVEEYKFLTKQYEISIDKKINIKVDDPNYTALVNDIEFSIVNGIDTVLRNCITSNHSVEDLIIYDWIYLLLYTRLMSRGEESRFKIDKVVDTIVDGKKTTKEVSEYIDVNLDELLKRMYERRNEFIKNPVKIIDIGNGISLYIMTPTRSDMIYVQQMCLRNPETSYDIAQAAVSVKAYIKDGVANIMTPDQRVKIMDTLLYDDLNEILSVCKENQNAFFDIINEFIRETNGGAKGLVISDFILFFYDL